MTRFERNQAFLKELAAEPELVAFVEDAAVITAKQIRTEAQPFRNTGYYIRHVAARGSQVRLTDSFWHLSEYGSAHNAPYAPARRGVIAAGLRLDASRI